MKRALPESPRSEINVTPLVDVCLVLLIIFMVVSPMLKQQLPEAPEPAAIAKKEDRIELEVREDRSVWFEKSLLTDDALLVLLRELHKQSVKQIVLLADSRLAYRDVRGVMEAARTAGFTNLTLAATKEPKASKAPALVAAR
ncbi:MAG: biopolymer transporter ExbD [Thermoanaerobaculia bacterium]